MQVMPQPVKLIPKRKRTRGGRSAPDDFWQERCDDARDMAEAGFTDREMADFFEVTMTTLYAWRAASPEFNAACRLGKELPDERTVGVLFTMVQGFEYEEEQAIKVKTGEHTEEVQVVRVKRYMPPDKTSVIFWLKNRRKNEWRDVQDVKADVNVTGTAADPRQLAIGLLATLRLAMDKAAEEAKTIEGTTTDADD